MEGLLHCSANYVPLTPISFLQRAATVYRDKTSIVYGASVRFSWKETYERCVKVASALVQYLGLSSGDIVATLAPNVPALYELHFSVPMAGAVLSTLNTRLDATTLALVLQQLKPKLIFVDYQYGNLALQAFNILLSTRKGNPPQLILINDKCEQETSSMTNNYKSPCHLDYDSLLTMGKADFEVIKPNNECDPISVNYTSGSTGNPKGVVYSHRAAYLNSLAEIFRCDMRRMPVFLWTVDMFRCNGWCLTWAMAAVGGTNVCIRNVSAKVISDAILLHKVTHLCGAPYILNILANSAQPSDEHRQIPSKKVNVIVAGALLNSQILKKVEELGFNVADGYGMTEVLGPAIVRPWKLESDEQEKIKSSEGLHNILIEGVDVKDPNTMKSVPHDGKTVGEVMFRSNILMSGYFNNVEATQEAFSGGWYHTKDLGIRHPDGSIQMKDRAKDIIVTEGETISTLEVEAALLSHPKVLEAAVVGKSDVVLNEVPCAFVKIKDGSDANVKEIIEFIGAQLPDYMVPKTIVFGDLPVNFNGKVQKFVLREKANAIISNLGNGNSVAMEQ
ncbi:butanoate--CoA ligase AAE1-like [Ricinus communis]|uniref:butanoate--CoA ligase AAE1-like n=1 Tax=Ricinus communis TaxID=3988 RepID=UPI00201AC242|nr:butanoate--CoA ligase AAE1-like [Ricinus communis]XP_048229483.1 butanoate--CoA ligase AAE1-like [Ricinus communis]XP_048229484.1 butanoate--CoA ligase AAE1-like [Ricinus communis]